ncbi:hypothetical protein RSAG8_12181, partial [Rhizoctonia solani AG-8 WAC10335]
MTKIEANHELETHSFHQLTRALLLVDPLLIVSAHAPPVPSLRTPKSRQSIHYKTMLIVHPSPTFSQVQSAR